MKSKLLIVLTILLIVACSKSENGTKNACNSANPLEDVSWLKAIKNTLTKCDCEISIIQGIYNGQTVFYTAMTDPLCNGINTPTLLDCEGKIVRTFTEADNQDYLTQVTAVKVLYRCTSQIK